MSNENENENHSLLLSQQSSLPLVPQQPHLVQPRNTRGDSDASNIIGAINQGFTACTAAGSDSALTNAHHVGSFATTEGSEGQNYSHIRGGFVSKTKTGKNKSDKEAESRFPRILYNEADDNILGEYQSLLRKQLELFEADEQDVINGTFRQGRTTPIKLGQIGLRCRHCAVTPVSIRTKGGVYFSQTIKGMYQIAQNMSKVHLCDDRCTRMPANTKKRMITLRSRKHRASGGRAYWIRHLREMGIYEDGNVLRARPEGILKKPPPVLNESDGMLPASNTVSTPDRIPRNRKRKLPDRKPASKP
jgi:hypothetical protein